MEHGNVYHFIGIGGSGMSPLAEIVMGLGVKVTGSDIRYSPHLADLEASGATVYSGHDPEVAVRADLVVISAAVPADDPELMAAKRAGISVMTRAQLLGELFEARRGIGVTGTHGKSTTSAMIASIFEFAGLDPTVAVGAGLSWAPSGGRTGRGEFMVVEADEAYKSFLTLKPEVAVVTNIDDDHRDHYGSFENIMAAFSQFLSQIKPGGRAVLCADDPNVLKAAAGLERDVVTYGKSEQADYVAANPGFSGFGSRFDVMLHGIGLGSIALAVPGAHNMINATAACAVAHGLGIDFGSIKDGLAAYRGAERRCQVLFDSHDLTVVDDYAHHPAEIRATLSALRAAARGRLVVVFQPQRFSRTHLLFDEFVKSFSLADVVGITEIYHEGTGESPVPGVTGKRLAESISMYEGRPVAFLADRHEALDFLRSQARPGDTLVTMGAGDIYRSARSLAQEFRGSAVQHRNGGGC